MYPVGETDYPVRCVGSDDDDKGKSLKASTESCTKKLYTWIASDKKPDEARCLVEKCYSKGTNTPTDTAVVGKCSSKDPNDKKLICAMASTISKALQSKNFDDQYTWLIPEKDPTNGGQFCLDPSSDAFKKNAVKLFKVIATKDGIEVSSQTYPDKGWKKEPSFCPAKGGSTAKTITMHIFTQPRCPPCDRSKVTLASEKRRLGEKGITLNVVEHDITKRAGSTFAREHGISVLKTPVFAVPNGNRGLSKVSDAIAAIKDAEKRISK
jgi:glutaredoxin